MIPFPRNMMFDDDGPDRSLTAAEELAVARLTPQDLAGIDTALLALAGDRWRKVALLVRHALHRCAASQPELPDVYYARRIRELVDAGTLEAHGNLERMRFSEVRIVADSPRTLAPPRSDGVVRSAPEDGLSLPRFDVQRIDARPLEALPSAVAPIRLMRPPWTRLESDQRGQVQTLGAAAWRVARRGDLHWSAIDDGVELAFARAQAHYEAGAYERALEALQTLSPLTQESTREDAIMAAVEVMVVMGGGLEAAALLEPRIVPVANYQSQLRRCWLYQAHRQAGNAAKAAELLTVIRSCWGSYAGACLVVAQFFAFLGEFDVATDAVVAWLALPPHPGWTADEWAHDVDHQLEELDTYAALGMAADAGTAWSTRLRALAATRSRG